MDQLAQPIGHLMRPTFTVDIQDSIELAARKLRENGFDVLPVTEDGYLAGALTEASMTKALADGMELTEPVGKLTQGALTANPATTGAEALRLFDNQSATALVVIDDAGRVMGVLTPSDLYPKRIVPPRPPMVGGMATPFGVYLTTGSLRAGVSHLALVTTGMTLFGLLGIGTILSSLLASFCESKGLDHKAVFAIENTLPYLIFLGGMRAIPLSGIHAAEHKVVHAIERGEELVPSVVRRMPRVHPRCGTNLAVGASLLIGIGTSEMLAPLAEFRLLIAGIATLLLWRPLGNLMQAYVTTKTPTEKHLQMGIRSGKELLEKYASSGGQTASFGKRIINSGMLHVIAGFLIVVGISLAIGALFHIKMLMLS
jgi:CBS domain-containing protein